LIMRSLFFAGLTLAGIALILMLREALRYQPVAWEAPMRATALGLAFVGAAIGRLGLVERSAQGR
jgi:hypothetical protein